MTPGEIAHAGESQLSARRLALLQTDCPVCDEGNLWADCTCQADLAEIELIDAALRARGKDL